MDQILHISLEGGQARALVACSTDLVEAARRTHDLSPTACAALGRTLTASAMLGAMLKGAGDSLTVTIRGGGPIGAIVCVARPDGVVKGYCDNPRVDLPPRPDGKLDVGGAVGRGLLRVLRSNGEGEPYCGVNEIVSGEIAEDVASYYAVSEQIPTVCAAGVLVDRDLSCLSAGGALVQLLPGAPDDLAARLEQNAASAPAISSIYNGGTPEDAAAVYLAGIEYDVFDSFECGYVCPCSRARTTRALLALGKDELEDMYRSPEETSLGCQFCGRQYVYSKDEIKALAEKAARAKR